MRRCPEYILELVSEYDRNLSLEWDQEDAAWYLVDRGERLFTLDHLDGTPIRNIDGCGSEVLEVLRRCDLGLKGKTPFQRRIRAARRRHQYAAATQRAMIQHEATGEARSVVKWLKQGNTPRSGAALQGVSKR